MIIYRVKNCFSTIKARFLHKLQYQPTLFHLRNYLYTYLFAKSQKGQIVTFYDETNLHNPLKNAQSFHEYLNWLNIYPDGKQQKPIMLEQYKPVYIKTIRQLIKKGDVYLCFCQNKTKQYDGKCRSLTREQVESNLKSKIPYKVRIKQPDTLLKYSDLVYGDQEQYPKQDPIIEIPSSGFQTQFKSVLADKQANITHIFHNAQNLPQLNEYLTISTTLNIKPPQFIALPSLLCPHIRTTTLQKLKRQEYEPSAILNYVALLGWRPFGDFAQNMLNQTRDYSFDLDDLIKYFNIQKITKRPIAYQMDKLKILNKIHLIKNFKQKLDSNNDENFDLFKQRLLITFGDCIEEYSDEYLKKALILISKNINKWAELKNFLFLFKNEFPQNKPKINPELQQKINNNLVIILKHIISPQQFSSKFFATKISELLLDFSIEISPDMFYKYLKYCVCGQPNAKFSAIDVCDIIGYEQSLARIQKCKISMKNNNDASVY